MKFIKIHHYVENSYNNKPSFVIEMSEITNAYSMFRNSNITEFSADMSSVTDARHMFRHTKLAEFSADMSSVTNANYVFPEPNGGTDGFTTENPIIAFDQISSKL